jgi:hypothetical protein
LTSDGDDLFVVIGLREHAHDADVQCCLQFAIGVLCGKIIGRSFRLRWVGLGSRILVRLQLFLRLRLQNAMTGRLCGGRLTGRSRTLRLLRSARRLALARYSFARRRPLLPPETPWLKSLPV